MMPELVSSPPGGAYLATFEYARNLLANCPTVFLDVFGVADADEAKDRIYYLETLATPDEEEDAVEGEETPETCPRPYIVIIPGSTRRGRVGVGEWSNEGELYVAIEVLVPNEFIVDAQADDSAVVRDKWRRRKEWAIALFGRIEQEITELSGSADEEGNPFLNVHSIEVETPPADPAEYCLEDYMGGAIRLGWK